MQQKQKPKILFSLGTLLGTVVGVGLFGLPSVAAHIGFIPMVVVFVIVATLTGALFVRFAEIVLATPQRDRIPGYVDRYLGPRWRKVSVTVSLLACSGALLAYLIVGGEFVRLALSPWVALPPAWAVLAFFVLGGLVIAWGTRVVAPVEFVLMVIFFVLIVVFFGAALPHFVSAHLTTFAWAGVPAAYGVILFALWGLDIVPETAELVANRKPLVRGVLIIGNAIAALAYLFFIITILGVNGGVTTPDALAGFLMVVGSWLTVPAALLGFIAVFTSYISVGLTLRQTLTIDVHFSRRVSLVLVLGVPVLLYALGFTNFITIISATGAVLIGAEAALILATHDALRKKQHSRYVRHWSTMLLFFILALGVLAEVWTLAGGR